MTCNQDPDGNAPPPDSGLLCVLPETSQRPPGPYRRGKEPYLVRPKHAPGHDRPLNYWTPSLVRHYYSQTAARFACNQRPTPANTRRRLRESVSFFRLSHTLKSVGWEMKQTYLTQISRGSQTAEAPVD